MMGLLLITIAGLLLWYFHHLQFFYIGTSFMLIVQGLMFIISASSVRKRLENADKEIQIYGLIAIIIAIVIAKFLIHWN